MCDPSKYEISDVSTTEVDHSDPWDVPNHTSDDNATGAAIRANIPLEPRNTTNNNNELHNNEYDDVTDSEQQQEANLNNESGSHQTKSGNQRYSQDTISKSNGDQGVGHLKPKVGIDKSGLWRSLSIKEEVRSRNKIFIIKKNASETTNDVTRKPSLKAKMALLSAKYQSKNVASVDPSHSNVCVAQNQSKEDSSES